MDQARVFKINSIPEGSRLKAYLDEAPSALKQDRAGIISFLSKVFTDCWNFLKDKPSIASLPTIELRLCTSDQFKEMERRESERAFSKEEAKSPGSL
jgi:hypothetical protein